MHSFMLAVELIAVIATVASFIWANVCAIRMTRQIADKRQTANWWNRSGGPNFFKAHQALYPKSPVRKNYILAMVVGCLSVLMFGITITLQH